MYIGACYYPEHWEEERLEIDIKLMKEAGFTVVRMGDYIWSRLEPWEGEYRFEWLEKIINKLGENGIRTVLCTPTDAAPMWLHKKHPDMLLVDPQGHKIYPGARTACCFNNPIFREYAEKIVYQLVRYFQNNPNIVLYQIDNELGAFPCCCDHCTAKYREWMKARYQTVENYNKECGMIFWSQEISEWDELSIPRKTRKALHPSAVLNFKRFCSDTVIDYCKMQADIIKKWVPHVEVTTNMFGSLTNQNHFELAEVLDVASFDIYPKADEAVVYASSRLDLVRSFKKKNFWMLEQQCSQAAFRADNRAVLPGEARMMTYKSIAHGADAIVYFRWRTCRFGAEQIGAGMLRQDGSPNRTYEELSRTCRETEILWPLLKDTTVNAQVAFVFSNDSIWSMQSDKKITKKLNYLDEMIRYYKFFENRNIAVDFVAPDEDISKYKLVIAPMLTVVTKEIAQWLEAYTDQGGCFMASYLSGFYDGHNVVTENYYQGELRNLLGIKVLEWCVAEDGKQNDMSMDGKQYGSDVVNMIVETENAKMVAAYEHNFYKGTPAVTVNQYGKGEAYYVAAASFGEDFYEDLLSKVVHQYVEADEAVRGEGLNIMERTSKEHKIIFVMNHDDREKTVDIKVRHQNLLTGDEVIGKVPVPAKDLLILASCP